MCNMRKCDISGAAGAGDTAAGSAEAEGAIDGEARGGKGDDERVAGAGTSGCDAGRWSRHTGISIWRC